MNNRSKKLLLLGGLDKSLTNFRGPMIEAFVQAGLEVVAAAPAENDWVPEQVAALGARYRAVSITRTGTNPLQDLQTLKNLRQLMRDEQPDIFVGYTIKPVIYGSMAAHAEGVPSINAMITGLGYGFIAGGIKQRIVQLIVSQLYRGALKHAHSVIFQNPDDRQLFIDRKLVNASKTHRIYGSGVDLAQYSKQPLPDFAEKGAIEFLLIARLLRDKGIGEYIDAARLVKAQHPQTRFTLVGPLDPNPAGLSKAKVEGWVQEGIIDYRGEADDVQPHYKQCHVYVLPSYREGTPRTVLEAMATGRAIITTDAPGCRETVRHGENGLLVPVKDAKALAAAMMELIENPERIHSMGESSLSIAKELYDVHRVNESILRILGIRL